MKNKNIFQSIKCAIKGIKLCLKEEKNYKLYIIIALIFCFFNIIVKVNKIEFCIFIILTAIVFVIETINTAVERVVDNYVKTKQKIAGEIKDISAGAVLLSGICFFVIEIIILLSHI